MTSAQPSLLVYDGDCGFCTSSARWIARRWRQPARAVPWQQLGADGLGSLGLTADEAGRSVWWISDRGRRRHGAAGIAGALQAAGGGWQLVGRVLGTPPVTWAAEPFYRLVTRYRHRLPGGTPACRVTPDACTPPASRRRGARGTADTGAPRSG